VLDDEEGDTLINVNLIDDEKAEKNVELKKKKPDYNPYDVGDVDEYGMVIYIVYTLTNDEKNHKNFECIYNELVESDAEEF
jgi:hypothetical protein